MRVLTWARGLPSAPLVAALGVLALAVGALALAGHVDVVVELFSLAKLEIVSSALSDFATPLQKGSSFESKYCCLL